MNRSISADDYSANTTALINIDKALEKFGIDAGAELDKLGFRPGDFSDSGLRVPAQRIAEVLLHAVAISGCEYFVLELVKEQTQAINGYFGMLLRTAPTLGDAALISARELYILQKGVKWTFRRESKHAHLSLAWNARHLDPDYRWIVVELGIAQGWFVMRGQTSRPVQLESVQFVRNAPANVRPYRQFFKAPVQFNCDVDQLNFPASQLDVPMSKADPYLHQAIRKLISQGEADRVRPTLIEEVSNTIRMLLPQGACHIDQVSRYLMRDKRTLQRQLREDSGVTFQSLLQAERLKMVQMYLRDSQKSLTEIALATGYRQPGNMGRAFRSKFGCTPKAWRERCQAHAPDSAYGKSQASE